MQKVPIRYRMHTMRAGRRRASMRQWARAQLGPVALLAALFAGSLPAAAQESDPPEPEPPATSTTVPVDTTTTTAAPPDPTTTTTPSPDPATTTTAPAGPTSTAAPTTTAAPEGSGADETESGAAALSPDAVAPGPAELDTAVLDEQAIAELLTLQRQYDELVADESATLAEYTIRLGRVEDLDAELARFDADIARTEDQLRQAVARVATLERDQRDNAAAHRRTLTDLDEARDRLQRQAVDAFVGGGSSRGSTLEVVLGADTAQSAGIAMTYAGVVLDVQQATIDQVEELEAELATLGAAIAADHEAAEAARADVEALERALEEQRAGVEEERRRAEAERAELEAALTAIRSRKAEYDQRLQTMAVESDNITSVLARAQRGQERAADLPLLRGPIDPTVVTSTFGPRLHPIFGTVRRHNGLDISGRLGDPIRAVDAGIVVMAELRNGFGNTIVIDHGDRIASVYAHQSRFEVGVGDVVARGELIGRVGSTGWSTGPHLHLEIRLDGIAVDPAGYLRRDEPLACELLLASSHALDRALLAQRDDCE